MRLAQPTRMVWLSVRQVLLCVLPLALGACVGSLEEGGYDSDQPSFSDPDQSPPTIDVQGCPSQASPGRVTMRRLTHLEYSNTVRDLFGSELRPSDSFASYDQPDPESGFNHMANTLTVDSQVLQDWMRAAIEVAAAAVASPDIMVCSPASREEAAECARRILAPLTRRAWRRSVTSDEVDALVAMVDVAGEQGEGFEEGMALAIRRMLMSPNFVFRVEVLPDPTLPEAQPLSAFAVASRLSYFLWRSTPDDELIDAAEEGRLGDPVELRAQVERMLADEKADSMFEDLSAQWLLGRVTARAEPDRDLYPEFDESLRDGLLQETQHFLQSFFRENIDVRSLISSNFAFLNQRTAEHYGVQGVSGETVRRVDLAADSTRGGLLTHGNVMFGTMTNTKVTSIENRGIWILKNLLCEQLPEPPADANDQQEQLLAELPDDASKRDISEARSENPACGSCHSHFDPIGLGLENFDLIGGWRDTIHGQSIDATGEVPGLGSFDGASELSSLLHDDPRFASCVAETFFTYALGRALDGADDRCAVQAVTQEAERSGFGTTDVVANIVQSAAFRFSVGEEQ